MTGTASHGDPTENLRDRINLAARRNSDVTDSLSIEKATTVIGNDHMLLELQRDLSRNPQSFIDLIPELSDRLQQVLVNLACDAAQTSHLDDRTPLIGLFEKMIERRLEADLDCGELVLSSASLGSAAKPIVEQAVERITDDPDPSAVLTTDEERILTAAALVLDNGVERTFDVVSSGIRENDFSDIDSPAKSLIRGVTKDHEAQAVAWALKKKSELPLQPDCQLPSRELDVVTVSDEVILRAYSLAAGRIKEQLEEAYEQNSQELEGIVDTSITVLYLLNRKYVGGNTRDQEITESDALVAIDLSLLCLKILNEKYNDSSSNEHTNSPLKSHVEKIARIIKASLCALDQYQKLDSSMKSQYLTEFQPLMLPLLHRLNHHENENTLVTDDIAGVINLTIEPSTSYHLLNLLNSRLPSDQLIGLSTLPKMCTGADYESDLRDDDTAFELDDDEDLLSELDVDGWQTETNENSKPTVQLGVVHLNKARDLVNSSVSSVGRAAIQACFSLGKEIENIEVENVAADLFEFIDIALDISCVRQWMALFSNAILHLPFTEDRIDKTLQVLEATQVEAVGIVIVQWADKQFEGDDFIPENLEIGLRSYRAKILADEVRAPNLIKPMERLLDTKTHNGIEN